MPNPFDLHGPAFLLFYAIFGALVVGILLLRQRFREAEAAPRSGALSDPHLIAFLRGGAKEAVPLAAIALRNRGLLEADDRRLWTTPRAQVERVDAPLDKALLACFPQSGGRIEGAMGDPPVRDALREIETTLEERGLLPSGAQRDARAVGLLVAAALLWIVAIGRVLTRDPRYGIGFTVLLAIAFTAFAAYRTFRRRTAAGDRLLADLRALFDGHRSAHPDVNGSTTAPALLAAVYGAAALSGSDGWLLEQIAFRPQTRKSDGSSSSGGGDGCGSGSSCGSGCGGGGGCGGGCGGCGG